MKSLKKIMALFLSIMLVSSLVYFPIKAFAVGYPIEGFVNGSSVRMRSGPGTSYSVVITTTNGQALTVTGEANDTSGDKWYAVTLNTGENGYIHSAYVTLKQSQTGGGSDRTGSVTGTTANIRSAPGTWNSLVVVLMQGTPVTVHGSALDSDGDLWYHITAVVGGTTYTGYIFNTLLQIDANYVYDAAFEEYLSEQGFPESYKAELRKVHAVYPNWIFVADHLGISWQDALSIESKLGTSLVSTYDAWKTMEQGAYDWNANSYIAFDSGTWYAAHKDVVAYYLDPRNFLNTSGIFQFVSMSYNKELHTKEGLQSVLNGTFMEGAFPETDSGYATWADVIMAASEQHGMSPYELASMIIIEQGSRGIGASISGTVSGYNGYYNFLNIGAYKTSTASAIVNGMIFAKGGPSYNRPWNTRAKSIIGGAEYYVKQYIAYGQDTLYYKKFNVVHAPYGKHQYMTNIQGAYSEASSAKKAYNSMLESALIFNVPVYSGIPEQKMPAPVTVGDNNFYLDTLNVDGHTLNRTFDLYTNTYSLQVEGSVKEINITANPKNAAAKVSGAGVRSLQVGENKIDIVVTSTSGRTNTYTIYVTRDEYIPELNPTVSSEIYNLSENYVAGIMPDTTTQAFLNAIKIENGYAELTDAGGNLKQKKVCTGDVLVIKKEDGSVYAKYTLAVMGDISGDGRISILDLAKLQRCLLKIDTLNGAIFIAGDINGDTRISVLDLSRVQRHLLELEFIGEN